MGDHIPTATPTLPDAAAMTNTANSSHSPPAVSSPTSTWGARAFTAGSAADSGSVSAIAGSFPLAPLLRPFHPGPRDRWLVLLTFVVTAAVGSLLASGPLGAGHGAALVGGFVVYLVVVLTLMIRGASRSQSPDPPPKRT